MILLVDNYDSFTYNLRRYLVRLGQPVVVTRHDAIDLSQSLVDRFQAIVLSPGPKTPRDAGASLEIVRRYSGRLPILGVCLGHQVIFEAFGGRIVRARTPVHGRRTCIHLLESRLFAGLEEQTSFARYHSLIASSESLPDCLKVTAWSREREIMAIEHRNHATFGVQFHPESVLSFAGYQVLKNFLDVAKLTVPDALPELDLVHPEQVWQDSLAAANPVIGREEQPVVLPKPVAVAQKLRR